MFYETITRFLGFKNYGDEYKVMGLAAYGRPRYVQKMETLLRLEAKGKFTLNLDYFSHHIGMETFSWDDCEPKTGDHFTQALPDLFGPQRAPDSEITQRDKDIAHSAQVMYEKALFHLLHHLHKTYQMDSLVLGGGCAFNSVANGKIYSHTPFKKLFVQAAAGDAGGALGAALYSWHVRSGQKRSFAMEHAYWGPSYSNAQIVSLLGQRQGELADQGCQWERLDPNQLICRAATAIADGLVVGWFQGRMEWGPRALGNRSILCDPRRADIKSMLNSKIKRRESFRPFAPAILREYVTEWFETDDNVPFMMKAFQIRKERRDSIPAVTHVDGSGRLQTVESHTNALYYRLIHAFYGMTGVPILLNTSFNENEPIVCSLNDALQCFLRTRMDMLVLGNCVLVRSS
jgi:carbamoyltransferase